MLLPDLMVALTNRGFRLELDPEDDSGCCIAVRGQVSRFTLEMRAALVEHKATLLQMLQPIVICEPSPWESAYEPIRPQEFVPLVGAKVVPKVPWPPPVPPEIVFDGRWRGIAFSPTIDENSRSVTGLQPDDAPDHSHPDKEG